MANDIASRTHLPAAFRHLFSTVGNHRNEIRSGKIVSHMARSQIPTLLIAFVTESNANREYEAGDILGQAAKYRGVIQPVKMSFDS